MTSFAKLTPEAAGASAGGADVSVGAAASVGGTGVEVGTAVGWDSA